MFVGGGCEWPPMPPKVGRKLSGCVDLTAARPPARSVGPLAASTSCPNTHTRGGTTASHTSWACLKSAFLEDLYMKATAEAAPPPGMSMKPTATGRPTAATTGRPRGGGNREAKEGRKGAACIGRCAAPHMREPSTDGANKCVLARETAAAKTKRRTRHRKGGREVKRPPRRRRRRDLSARACRLPKRDHVFAVCLPESPSEQGWRTSMLFHAMTSLLE